MQLPKTEVTKRTVLDRATDDYREYLAREVEYVLIRMSRVCRNREAHFASGMGIFFFEVGEDMHYRGFGAGKMLDRFESALDDYGWNVIPTIQLTARDGTIIS